MTVQLDWPSDVVVRLTEEARKKGLSLDDYVLQALLPGEARPSACLTTRRRAVNGRTRASEFLRFSNALSLIPTAGLLATTSIMGDADGGGCN